MTKLSGPSISIDETFSIPLYTTTAIAFYCNNFISNCNFLLSYGGLLCNNCN